MTEDVFFPHVLLFSSHIQENRLVELCCLQLEEKTTGDFPSPKHEFPWHPQTPVQNPLDGSKLTFVRVGEKCTCAAKHSGVQSSYVGEWETLKLRVVLPSGNCRQGEIGWALTLGRWHSTCSMASPSHSTARLTLPALQRLAGTSPLKRRSWHAARCDFGLWRLMGKSQLDSRPAKALPTWQQRLSQAPRGIKTSLTHMGERHFPQSR